MKRATVTLASALTALLLGMVSVLSLLAVSAAAQQHGAGPADDHGTGQVSSPRNAIQAQAGPGIVRLESFRFTWLACLARVATAIEALPGVSEVGQVPGSMPPIVIVRFDSSQTAAEAVVQAAREGLESDPFNPAPVAVTLVHAPVQAPAALAPIVRFTATDLWIRALGDDALRLNTELFDCGTCINQVIQALQRMPGVREARPDRSPGGTVVLVTFDPSVISREALAAAAKEALEADPLLPVTVAIHFFSPDEGQAAP